MPPQLSIMEPRSVEELFKAAKESTIAALGKHSSAVPAGHPSLEIHLQECLDDLQNIAISEAKIPDLRRRLRAKGHQLRFARLDMDEWPIWSPMMRAPMSSYVHGLEADVKELEGELESERCEAERMLAKSEAKYGRLVRLLDR